MEHPLPQLSAWQELSRKPTPHHEHEGQNNVCMKMYPVRINKMANNFYRQPSPDRYPQNMRAQIDEGENSPKEARELEETGSERTDGYIVSILVVQPPFATLLWLSRSLESNGGGL